MTPYKKNGADDEARTRYLHLGKVALYQMSYIRKKWCLRSESNQRHVDFQSTALPTELQRHTIRWRPRTGSNRRPLAWQASALTNWATGPKWWEQQGSNLWPPACKAGALPAELYSHFSFNRCLRLTRFPYGFINILQLNTKVNTFF